MKSPALSQLHPKSEVTGFASFSQLLLGNANADADSSTGFLCGRKATKSAQALFQSLWGRWQLTFLSKTPTGVSEVSDTSLQKNHHLFFCFLSGWAEGWILPSPLLCLSASAYRLSEICRQVRACTAYTLHRLHRWRSKFPKPQLMGLGSYKGPQPSRPVANCSRFAGAPSAFHPKPQAQEVYNASPFCICRQARTLQNQQPAHTTNNLHTLTHLTYYSVTLPVLRPIHTS